MSSTSEQSGTQGISLKQSTCPYCGVGCGIDVMANATKPLAQQLSGLTGTPEHPANFGRLCVKGSHLLETNGEEQRLHSPLLHGKEVHWSEATDYVADKLSSAIKEHGPESVAFYVSGQLLTEDYYVANKLMKGFIGSANIDTNSRLCMSSAVAAYKRALGADAVPCCYEDLENCQLLILTGSNAAWTHPVLFQRIERAKKRNPTMKVVVLDPRETASCSIADYHIALKPGSDAALFNGLLSYLVDNNAIDKEYVASYTEGFEAAWQTAKEWGLSRTAEYCDVDELTLAQFYQDFAETEKAITFFSMGINQSSSGVDKGNAIINCHLATGRIGKVGAGPFSITGQPNAMGGREVGGLANLLAAHMDIDNPSHRSQLQEFWQSPFMADKPGLKAVDLFKKMANGDIKFVWIMATNPVVSMPNRKEVEQALTMCETVVVSDIVDSTDTLAFADVALPATGWSEKDGTVTNSERRISRQRGLIAPFGQAKHDWQIMCDVAVKMGFEQGFNFTSSYDVFIEHAKLSGLNNNGSRAFDISAMANMSQAEFDNLSPIQWPVNEKTPEGTKRLFTDNQFYTASKKAQFIAITPSKPSQLVSVEYPFIVNTGRMRDQWHTMTRTGKAAKLLQHSSISTLTIHPADADKLDVKDAQLVELRSAVSGDKPVILPVEIASTQRRGEVFAPIHWSETWGSHCALGKLFDGSNDKISGQPELKHGAVSIEKIDFALSGLLVVEDAESLSQLSNWFEYWVKVPTQSCHSLYFSTNEAIDNLLSNAKRLWGESATIVSAESASTASVLVIKDDRLVAAVFINDDKEYVPLDWLESIFNGKELTEEQRVALLRQRPEESFLQGSVVCSCFGVREKPILDAITQGANTVEKLGETLKCGTNCGSCKSELKTMINRVSDIPVSIVDDGGVEVW